jgi:hypothetical protein
MFEVGQEVVSKRIGGRSEFTGRIVSIVQNYRSEALVVIQDERGLSWLRETHELSLPEAPSTLPAHG